MNVIKCAVVIVFMNQFVAMMDSHMFRLVTLAVNTQMIRYENILLKLKFQFHYLILRTKLIKGFFDCSCIKLNGSIDTTITYEFGTAQSGMCSRKCGKKLILFLVIIFILVTAESICLTPATMLILMLVEKPIQPLGMGMMRVSNILLASIPIPIVVGHLLDNACMIADNECIGDDGNCLEYNARLFHFTLFGACAATKTLSCILIVVFSLHIHRSYVIKVKYRNKATLNHDVTTILTPEQRYRIDSIVASSENGEQNKTDQKVSKKKRKTSPSNDKTNDNVTDQSVILKRIRNLSDSSDGFTSICRSQTPNYSLDKF
jgi:hypothetical protein